MPRTSAAAWQATQRPETAAAAAESPIAEPDGIDLSPVFEDPWWPEWLAHHDRDGNLVEDAVEHHAREAALTDARTLAPLLLNYGRAPTTADAKLLQDLLGATIVHEFQWIPTILAAVPVGLVSKAGTLPGVVAVEWDRPLHPLLDVSAPAMQSRDATGSPYNGQTAQSLGYTGQGMVIAVLDTGIGQDHPAFVGKWIAGAEAAMQGSFAFGVNPDVGPITCIDPADDSGHGTHVAATALGKPATGNQKGTAMDARLVEVKIAVGGVSGVSGTIVQPFAVGGGDELGFEWVLDWNAAIDAGTPLCGATLNDRIDVATLSFGTGGPGGPNAGTTEAIITQLTQTGVVVTIAAGNNGGAEFTISSPGNAAGALSIANSDDKNTINRVGDSLASTSSRGPNQGTATSLAALKDRNRKPDMAAPGTNIVAANGLTEGNVPGNGPFGDDVSFSGTSMATPQVAGVAALLLQAGEDAKAETGGINRMRPTGTGFTGANAYVKGQHPVRDALIHSADYMTAGVTAAMITKWQGPGADGLTWNNGYGYGHVNAFGALCWAWVSVLMPAGATPPDAVAIGCDLLPPASITIDNPAQGAELDPRDALTVSGRYVAPPPTPCTTNCPLTDSPLSGQGHIYQAQQLDPFAAATALTLVAPGTFVDVSGRSILSSEPSRPLAAGQFARARVFNSGGGLVFLGTDPTGLAADTTGFQLFARWDVPADLPGGRYVGLAEVGWDRDGDNEADEWWWIPPLTFTVAGPPPPTSGSSGPPEGGANQATGWSDPAEGGTGEFVFIDDPAEGSMVAGPTTVSGRSGVSDSDPAGGGGGGGGGGTGDDGWVVIAVIDTGINPYNPEFAPAAGQPSAAHPSTYISGFPASANAITLTCTATANIPTSCASDFAGIAQNQLRWIPGTKIIGAISTEATSSANVGPSRILDNNGHGTASASVAVGTATGTCPQCLLVVVEGFAGLTWAAQQPWIDVLSNSWGRIDNAGVPVVTAADNFLFGSAAELAATKAFTDNGGSVLFAAGNGPGNLFVAPDQTYTSPYTGPDWHMVVGAVFTSSNGIGGNGERSVAGSGKPVTVSSYGSGNIPAACHASRAATCQHSGTSSATPIAAGVTGAVLARARDLVDDNQEGPRGAGAAASGAPVAGNLWLADGRLTRAELWNLVLKTARPLGAGVNELIPTGAPNSPAAFAYAGYGIVNRASRDAALGLLNAGSPAPARPNEDQFFSFDSALRRQLWGTWTGSKTAATGDENLPAQEIWKELDHVRDVGERFEAALLRAIERGVLNQPTSEPDDDGPLLGVWGEIGDVTLSDTEGILEVRLELSGIADGNVPTLLGTPFTYQVDFLARHNGVDSEYRATYDFDALEGDVFGFFVLTAPTDNLQTLCPVTTDLSGSFFNIPTGEAVWRIPMNDLKHNNKPPRAQGCAAFTVGGRGLQAGDVLTQVSGESSLRAGLVVLGGLGDTSTAPDYTVGGVPVLPVHLRVNGLEVGMVEPAADGAWSIDVDFDALEPDAQGLFLIEALFGASSDTVTYQGASVNLPPTANAGLDQEVSTGASVTLEGSGGDPEEGPLTFAWAQTAGDAVELTSPDAATAQFTAPAVTAATTLTFRLTVTDDGGLTGTDDVSIVVRPEPGPASVIVVTLEALRAEIAYDPSENAEWSVSFDNLRSLPPGPITIVATAYDDTGVPQLADDVGVIILALPPTASIVGPSSALRGEALIFDGTGSADDDGAIVAYDWNFGDGATAAGPKADHAYATLGVFTVTLVVTDDDGATASATLEVDVINAGPTGAIAGPSETKKNKWVTFDGSGSTDPDGSIASWSWDLGDGTTAQGSSIEHRYRNDGTYTVSLTVTDSDGGTGVSHHEIHVGKAK